MSLIKRIKQSQKIVGLTLGVLTVLSFVLMSPANGQSAYESMATQESVHVPATKLRLFIQAQEAVNNVQDQYLQAAQNPSSETADSLQRSMGEEIVRTIEARGLTVDEYNTILAEVQKAEGDTAKRYYDMIRTE
ncbi:MAG: DUF4168 domain-containing protein [Alphaproteobacteria bacterium]